MELKEGMKVKIKSWNELTKTYPVDEYGNIIFTKLRFLKSKSYICSKEITVGKIESSKKTPYFKFEEDIWITAEMCEPINNTTTKGQEHKLDSILNKLESLIENQTKILKIFEPKRI